LKAVEEPRRERYRRGRGCSVGCGGFLIVLTVGIALSLFDTSIGIGASVHVPFTNSNATFAAAIGAKGKTATAMPAYVRGRVGGNQNFINQSQTTTIGPAEGAAVLVIGHQDGAPSADLELVAR
jgi:hypothetical protein